MPTFVFDLSRAPFALEPRKDAAQVAEDIVDCFRQVSALHHDKVSLTTRAALGVIGLPDHNEWASAALHLSSDMDAGIGDGGNNAYHNSQHFCEVMLSTLYLSLRAPLDPARRAQMIVAALAHDFFHDGGANDTPFRLERRSVESLVPYLNAAGIPAGDQTDIVAIILATETTVGLPFARQCYLQSRNGHPPPPTPPIESRLAPLGESAQLAMQAVLLTEADILPSVGLTTECAMRAQAKLSSEWGKPLSAENKLHFLEHVFGDFCVSRFFTPNVERLKAAVRAMIDSPAGMPRPASEPGGTLNAVDA